jgi:N6-adenosine-specific RNA methylase IME4
MPDYDAHKDAHDSYYAAIEAKRVRGDHLPYDFFGEACRAVATALEMEKVTQIRRDADMARAAARAAKNTSGEIDMAEVRIRAERRIGRIMRLQREAGLFNKGGGDQKSDHRVGNGPGEITLAEMEITKHIADRARRLEELPDDFFEDLIAAWRQRCEGARAVTLELFDADKKARRRAEIDQQREDIRAGRIILSEDGPFNVVAIDPPWKYGRDYDPAACRVASPYPEMSQDELLELDLPFADDCALFLWTTHQFIWDARELLDHWGFDYKAVLVWDKNTIGMGFWLRMQCEFCLLGIRGKPVWENTRWRDIIREPRREHSRKPEQFYRMVEDITAGARLDYFSRKERPGWANGGNDTERFNGLP